jgi:hypothetical protein
VLEREFLVSLHAGRGLTANEVALLEGIERLGDASRIAAQALERPAPEDLADDRSVEDDGSLLGGKTVDASGDDPLHARR